MNKRMPYREADSPKYSSAYSLRLIRKRKSSTATTPAAVIRTPKSSCTRSIVAKPGIGVLIMRLQDHSGLSRIQNHFAELLAFFQTLMRRRGLTQRKALVDNRFDLAGENMFHHLMKVAHGTHE